MISSGASASGLSFAEAFDAWPEPGRSRVSAVSSRIDSRICLIGEVAAEAALSQSEERYRTLVESATDIIITLDLQGRVTTVNPAIERILGYAPEELIGRPLSQLVSPEQMAMQQDMLRRKLEGEPADGSEQESQRQDRQENEVRQARFCGLARDHRADQQIESEIVHPAG